jgi:hypothetical protein
MLRWSTRFAIVSSLGFVVFEMTACGEGPNLGLALGITVAAEKSPTNQPGAFLGLDVLSLMPVSRTDFALNVGIDPLHFPRVSGNVSLGYRPENAFRVFLFGLAQMGGVISGGAGLQIHTDKSVALFAEAGVASQNSTVSSFVRGGLTWYFAVPTVMGLWITLPQVFKSETRR